VLERVPARSLEVGPDDPVGPGAAGIVEPFKRRGALESSEPPHDPSATASTTRRSIPIRGIRRS
jgi:hypothetical protein